MRSPVVVWATKYAKGLNADLSPVEEHPVMDLGDALFEDFETDAHFVPYSLLDASGKVLEQAPRVNKSALKTLETSGYILRFYAAVIDVDCPSAHKQGNEASPVWRELEAAKLKTIDPKLAHGMASYDTRGGYRLVWRLPKALKPVAYLKLIASLRDELGRHDITADELTDWTRCYRLPSVVRDGVEQCYEADIMRLGDLVWKPSKSEAKTTGVFDGIGDAKVGFTLEEGERIGEGGRNSTLLKMAGALRRAGFTQDDILEHLTKTNDERCDPPLPLRELEHMARYVSERTPLEETVPQYPAISERDGVIKRSRIPSTKTADGQVVRFPSNSETVLARAAGEDLEGLVELVGTQGLLWKCNEQTQLWASLSDEDVVAAIMSFDGENYVSGFRKGAPTIAKLNISAAKAYGSLRLLKAEKNDPDFFESAPKGVAFKESFVRLDKWHLQEEPLKPEHRQQTGLAYPYEEDAVPVQFIEFLRSCWSYESDRDAMIDAFREWLGLALLGEAPTYQKAVVMIGDGANGKSTAQEICKCLFPSETVTAIPPQDMDNEYRRAMLASARLNIVAEMPEADILTSEAVKAMISGDVVTARHIRQAPFQFKPKAAHLFSANALPSVRDMSPGFWRRWLVFPFKRNFAEHEQDRGLAKRIIGTELATIASWAIAGVGELAYRGRFEEPKTCLDAKTAWRRNVDSVASFIDSTCTADEDGTNAGDLYARFVEWTAEVGLQRMSQRKFGERLRLLGYTPKKRSGRTRYDLRVLTGAPSYVQ